MKNTSLVLLSLGLLSLSNVSFAKRIDKGAANFNTTENCQAGQKCTPTPPTKKSDAVSAPHPVICPRTVVPCNGTAFLPSPPAAPNTPCTCMPH